MAERTAKLELVQGVEGQSLYLNDRRIAGPKPWGGGKVLRSWTVNSDDVLDALSPDKEKPND